jgi:uncharacterized membrane protein
MPSVHWSHLNYLPVALPFFSLLVGALLVLVALVLVGALRTAYERIGLSPPAATLMLLGSLIGSYFNIPVAHLPGEQVVSAREVYFYGVQYIIPVAVEWPGTVVAINLGGAVIPVLLSLYLLAKRRLWGRGLLAAAGVAAVCYALAEPVPGVGIALPVFVPPIAAAIIALLLSRADAAPLAYVAGSLGALIGADLLNLDKVRGLGAPVASIGGAGTFDGIFLTGVLAVLLASVFGPGEAARRKAQFG